MGKKKKRWSTKKLRAFFYNLFHGCCGWTLQLRGILVAKGAFLKNVRFDVKGRNIRIEIGQGTRVEDTTFYVRGNNCRIVIGGGHGQIRSSEFWAEDDNSRIFIGKDAWIKYSQVASTEGELIEMGDDVMFINAEFRNGDSHAIVQQGTNVRINWPKSVHIGNHCWFGAHTRVLKGTILADNCVVATGSICCGRLDKPNCIYGGNPAKLLKEGIDWNRSRYGFIRQ